MLLWLGFEGLGKFGIAMVEVGSFMGWDDIFGVRILLVQDEQKMTSRGCFTIYLGNICLLQEFLNSEFDLCGNKFSETKNQNKETPHSTFGKKMTAIDTKIRFIVYD